MVPVVGTGTLLTTQLGRAFLISVLAAPLTELCAMNAFTCHPLRPETRRRHVGIKQAIIGTQRIKAVIPSGPLTALLHVPAAKGTGLALSAKAALGQLGPRVYQMEICWLATATHIPSRILD